MAVPAFREARQGRGIGLAALQGNPASFRAPKVSKGERRETCIQWIQPPKAVSDRSFRQTTSGAHGSANRADCLPRGKPFGAPAGAYLLPRGADAPTTARTVGLPPRGGPVLSFEAKESTKESQRHGDSCGPPRYALFANIGVPGTAVPGSCICSGLPVANCLRQLCPLGTRSLSAQASACGSRTVGRPEFIRGVQFRPLGRNSLTTFRGQTALRGCPRARGVRCRIAPYRSLCSPPTLPAGRFGLRPRPHWGHASLRDSSLRSPAGKKPFTAHF